MSTQYERPISGKLTREDFKTLKECDDEILNIQQIKKNMVKENAERTALNNILTAIENYYRLANWSRGNSFFKEVLIEKGFRYTKKKIDGFHVLTPSGEKIKI